MKILIKNKTPNKGRVIVPVNFKEVEVRSEFTLVIN